MTTTFNSSIEQQAIKSLKVIYASAGTGKTFQLSAEYVRALQKEKREFGTGIIATTFTNKASAELLERVRRELLKEGNWAAAQGVLAGYVGTVNAICGRIVSEYAIETGLSPDFNIISEEQWPAMFAMAVDNVISEFADEIDQAATRLQIDWRGHVHDVINLARNNDLGPKLLETFAQRSYERMIALLPELRSEETAELLDSQLLTVVEQAIQDFEKVYIKNEKTKKTIETLNETRRSMRAGRIMNWEHWTKLSKLQSDKSSQSMLRSVNEAGAAHARHPRFHEDIAATIFGVFNCAAAALNEYSAFKRTHGLIDFVDQEHLALRTLRRPEVREQFKEKAQVLLVDEFQDTSPIQLAVFLEIARLVESSVWVGDEKQSIFGFRGSDPELMGNAVGQLVKETGAVRTRLRRSYRSRPPLVGFANALFSRCAALMNISPESAVVEKMERTELPQQNVPLHMWWLENGRNDLPLRSLAQSIAGILNDSNSWLVVDKHSKELRPIRGSDIAVLCRTNQSRMDVAKYLSQQGLTVATERNRLLDTPECAMALAALRYLADDGDTLAVAEIANLLLDGDKSWLNAWLSSGVEALESSLPCLAQLRFARSRLADRTPAEALEIAIISGGVDEAALSWGQQRQRLANLDALRGLARAFEEYCLSAKQPATLTGLIIYLHNNVTEGGNQPPNPDLNGIHILTYHRSKGLEWPLVVLYDLDTPGRGSPFGITVESDETELDPLQPLSGRSIRYWPWPYGRRWRDTVFDAKLGRTKEARESSARTLAENLRLLYVGVTRARDYLIFAAKPSTYGTQWLDTLVDEYDQKLLTLPFPQEPVLMQHLLEGEPSSLARIEIKSFVKSEAFDDDNQADTFVSSISADPTIKTVPYLLSPSSAQDLDFAIHEAKPFETVHLGERFPLGAGADMQVVGDCVHAFLAAEEFDATPDHRIAQAKSILKNWNVTQVQAKDLVAASNRLRNFISTQFPDAVIGVEVPVRGRFGLRRINGSIDMLVETAAGLVIIDHKSFPGKADQWHQHALAFRHQLALYRHVLESVSTQPVIGQYIHLPIVGAIIKADCSILHQ